ncbi:MAG: iron-containing alcohol dehydrogenase [Solirubrobacterales bacterium]
MIAVGRVRALAQMEISDQFLWHDGGRLIAFRTNARADALEILASRNWEPFELLTTERARDGVPELAEAATAVHEVPLGPVPQLGADLIEKVAALRLVAVGGGRVIDVAKGIAAARSGGVCAIPTTLSGAEMTSSGRLTLGYEQATRVRPAIVLADPELMTSLPEPQLRASAMNSLAHGVESLFTRMSNPAAGIIALHGITLIRSALDEPRETRRRADLALGSIFCSWAMASSGFGLHHVLCQSLVRTCGTTHSETHAAVLPVTIDALAQLSPRAAERLAAAFQAEPTTLGERVRELSGSGERLADLGLDKACLANVPDVALERVELRNMAKVPDRPEIEALLERAW